MSALGDEGAESAPLVWTEKEGVESQAVKLDNDVMVSQLCESSLDSGFAPPSELGLTLESLRFGPSNSVSESRTGKTVS